MIEVLKTVSPADFTNRGLVIIKSKLDSTRNELLSTVQNYDCLCNEYECGWYQDKDFNRASDWYLSRIDYLAGQVSKLVSEIKTLEEKTKNSH